MNRIIKIGMDVHSTNYNFCLRNNRRQKVYTAGNMPQKIAAAVPRTPMTV